MDCALRGAPGMSRRRRVLVVEDDQDIREMMEELLRSHYQVTIAEDGVEALEMLTRNRQKFDALVVDLELPRLSGTDLLQELKSRGVSIPVLVVSGMPEADKRAREARATFIAKPFDVVRLEAKVHDLVLRAS
jgi:DNA-binding response OmpR family regulator